jgi:hypothetical protein
MKMTKNTKMLLGVGALAVAAYLVYMQGKKKETKSFAEDMSMSTGGLIPVKHCAKGYTDKGGLGYICCNPAYTAKTAEDIECTGGKPGTMSGASGSLASF